MNNWPNAMGAGITHLVVWTRTTIATTPEKEEVVDNRKQGLNRRLHTEDPLGSAGDKKTV
jgi:hypothetical protein